MPQMSSLNWLILNLYFTNLMILLMTIIYYIKNHPRPQPSPLMKKFNFKLKW